MAKWLFSTSLAGKLRYGDLNLYVLILRVAWHLILLASMIASAVQFWALCT